MDPTPLIQLHAATVRYCGAQDAEDHGDDAVFTALDFTLREGERLGLTGPNGGGKTTLLLALVGLTPLSAGTLRHRGRPVATERDLYTLRREVGFVFQNADDQLFSPTVLEDVAFGPLNLGLSAAEAEARSLAVLERLGIRETAHKLTHTLSGGRKRLAALATALVMEPRALLLDEPTNDLDATSRAALAAALRDTSAGFVIVSHDETTLRELTHRRLRLEEGRLRETA